MPEIACPRCGQSAEERFYGPCEACRQELNNQPRNEPDPCYTKYERMNGERAVAPPAGGCKHDAVRARRRQEWAETSRLRLKT